MKMKRLQESDVGGCGVHDGSGHPPTEDEIQLCAAWLKEFAKPSKRITPNSYSYGLKHRVEDWTRIRGHHEYVPNGAFIVAAIRGGYRAVHEVGDINAKFNLVWKAAWWHWATSRGEIKCG